MPAFRAFCVLALALLAGCPQSNPGTDASVDDREAPRDTSTVDAVTPSDTVTARDTGPATDAPVTGDVPSVMDVAASPDVPSASDVAAPSDVPSVMDVPSASDVPSVMDVLVANDGAVSTDASAAADVACPSGQRFCGGRCVGVGPYENACDPCGLPCCEGNRCQVGQCYPGCPAGWSPCPFPTPRFDCAGGVCRNLPEDPENCGRCGRACAMGQRCVLGECVN